MFLLQARSGLARIAVQKSRALLWHSQTVRPTSVLSASRADGPRRDVALGGTGLVDKASLAISCPQGRAFGTALVTYNKKGAPATATASYPMPKSLKVTARVNGQKYFADFTPELTALGGLLAFLGGAMLFYLLGGLLLALLLLLLLLWWLQESDEERRKREGAGVPSKKGTEGGGAAGGAAGAEGKRARSESADRGDSKGKGKEELPRFDEGQLDCGCRTKQCTNFSHSKQKSEK